MSPTHVPYQSPLAALVDAAPASVRLGVGRPAPRSLPAIAGLLAGAAEVDITPPPGMPKAGHSRNAQDGVGFRTRLRVRVIHLRAGTRSLALVAGDMHAGSAVVHRLVAADVGADTDVPLAGIFLGSTHTHAGPGQFHGCDFYNKFASNRPGFDPAYTHFLVERISAAVREAVATRRRARLAWGSTEVWGYTRNRSLEAHVHNYTVDDKSAGAQHKYSAINPWLHLLRVDAESTGGGSEPLAALAVFSIHGTGISRRDPAYNADVWAYLTGELARRIEARSGTRAVVGAVEGTHGDMTPAVRAGLLVYHEAERVGRGIGEAAAALHESLEPALSGDVRLAAGFREIDLGANPVVRGISLPLPAVGMAKLAGAIENTTPVLDRIPPFKAGYPKPRVLARGAHGAKWVVGSQPLQRVTTPAATLPRVLPLQLLAIGGRALLALPFEVTVEAGRRVEACLAAVPGLCVDGVGEDTAANGLRAAGGPRGAGGAIVASAANDYWDYLTTPEEYELQCYEGASTLYGPRSLAFVTAAAADLARDLVGRGEVDEPLQTREFRFHARRYLPASSPEGSARARHFGVGAPVFVEATPTADAYWELEWAGPAPGDLRWDRPLARVDTAGGQPLADDQGWHLSVVSLAPRRTGARHEAARHEAARLEAGERYALRWYGPPLGRPGSYRFVLTANAGYAELVSEPFS